MPWEATETALDAAKGRIVFEGVTDGRVLISTDIPYAVGSHSDTEGSNSQPPTPSQWEQFVDEVRADADRAEQAAKDAEATLQDVKNAGAQAVTDIGAAKDSALDAIVKAGEEAAGSITADVQAAGTAAVSTVNDARDEAVEQIETANAHSPQINDDTGYWQTWDAETGQYVDTTIKAEGPQGNKGDTGNPGPQGETGATPQLTIGTVTTLEPDEDATVTITGTTEAPVLNFGIPKGEQGDGSTSGSDLPATTAADSGKAPTVNAAGTGYELTGPYAPLSAAIRPTASGNPVSITDSVEWPLQGLKVYGKSTQDGTPSLENPVPIASAGEGGSIELTITGKNLLIENQYQISEYNVYFGRAESYPGFLLKAHTEYTLSVPDFADPPDGIYFNDKKTMAEITANYNARMCSYTPDDDIVVSFDAYWANGRPENVTKLQLEIGSSATAYEPPKSPQFFTPSTPNGLPGIPVDSGGNYTDASGQQLLCDTVDFSALQKSFVLDIFDTTKNEFTVSYTKTLNGFVYLTVDMVGKATQGYGKTCICNIFKSVLDGNAVAENCIWQSVNSDRFNLKAEERFFSSFDNAGAAAFIEAHPLVCLFARDRPITTPLSDEELAAYRALHTYDGTTVVSTAEDVAGLEVMYVADAQKYIDGRLTAVESHIQEIAAAQLNAQTGG